MHKHVLVPSVAVTLVTMLMFLGAPAVSRARLPRGKRSKRQPERRPRTRPTPRWSAGKRRSPKG